MRSGTFATVINCMDGRVQDPIATYMKEKYHVDYIDTITEPGPVKTLAKNNDESLIESIKKKVAISVVNHHSLHIANVAHDDCAGNPTTKEVQINEIGESLKVVQLWGFIADVIGVWIDVNWQIHEICFRENV